MSLRAFWEGVNNKAIMPTGGAYVEHPPGNVVSIFGPAGSGKTKYMVCLATEKLRSGLYLPCRVLSTVWLPEFDIMPVSWDIIFDFFAHFVERGYARCMLLMDEADQHAGHREWKTSKNLPNAWQFVKMGITVIYVKHEGLGVDSVLRDATMVSVGTKIDVANDLLIAEHMDIRGCKGRRSNGELKYTRVVQHQSALHWRYSRWQPVV